MFLTHRRIGKAEALYRIIPSIHLSESDVKCVFVTAGWPESRHYVARKVSDDWDDIRFVGNPSIFKLKDKTGLWEESPKRLVSCLQKY